MTSHHSTGEENAEILAIRNSAPGFWLSVAPVSPCDQTIESELEISRFYACEMPLALREYLASDASAPFSAEGAQLADQAAFDAIESLAPENRNLARKIQEHKAWRANPKHLGANFIHHADASGRHWGAAFFMLDMGLFLASKHDEPHKASTRIQKLAVDIASLACEKFLGGMQIRWKLPDPDIVHRRADWRAHWMDDWPPSCMDDIHNEPARALAERRALDDASLSPETKYPAPRI